MNLKMNIQSTGLLLVISIFALNSCATIPKTNSINKLFSDESENDGAEQVEDFYTLGPDDIINITVEQHPEWSGKFTIGPDGNIVIPELVSGEFAAEGITKDTLAKNIAEYLDTFITNPRVAVEIDKYASQVIYVFGEVARPGRIPTEGRNITLRDAIIMAGLTTKYAAMKRVYIVSSSRKKQTRQVVNLYRILYRGELKRNIGLKPGDVVYVPKTFLGIINSFISTLLSPLSAASTAAAVAP